MEDLILQECDRHSFERHVVVHESGHVIAALDQGIPFSHIAMYGDCAPNSKGGLYVAAAEVVMLDEDPVTYVAPDPSAALRFLSAGHCAELVVLGDAMPNAEASDIAAWKVGVGLPRDVPVTEADLDARVGASFIATVDEVAEWAAENATRIERLADHLEALPRPSDVPYDEVVEFMSRN